VTNETYRYVKIEKSTNGQVVAERGAWDQRTKKEGNNEN